MNHIKYLAKATTSFFSDFAGKWFMLLGSCKSFYKMLAMDRIGCRMNHDISYLMEYSRHRQILPFGYLTPMVSPGVFLAPNATLGISYLQPSGRNIHL